MNKSISDEELEKVSGGTGNNPSKGLWAKPFFSFDDATADMHKVSDSEQKSLKPYSPRISEGYQCQKE